MSNIDRTDLDPYSFPESSGQIDDPIDGQPQIQQIGFRSLATFRQSSEFIAQSIEAMGISAFDIAPENRQDQWKKTACIIRRFMEASLIFGSRSIAQKQLSPEQEYEQKVQQFNQHCDEFNLISSEDTRYELLTETLEKLIKSHFSEGTYRSFSNYLDTLPNTSIKEKRIKQAIIAILGWQQELSQDEFSWLKQNNLLPLIFQNISANLYAPSFVVLASQIAKNPHLRKRFESIQLSHPVWELLKIPMTCVSDAQAESFLNPLIEKLNSQDLQNASILDAFTLLRSLTKLRMSPIFSAEEKIQIVQELAKDDLLLNAKTLLNTFEIKMDIELKKLLLKGTQDVFKTLLNPTYQVKAFNQKCKNMEAASTSAQDQLTCLRNFINKHFSKETCKSFETTLNKIKNPQTQESLIRDALITTHTWKTELSTEEFNWIQKQGLFSLIFQDLSIGHYRSTIIVLSLQIAKDPELRQRFESIHLKHKALQLLQIPLTCLGDSQEGSPLSSLIEILNQSLFRRASTQQRLFLLASLLCLHVDEILSSEEKMEVIKDLCRGYIMKKVKDLILVFVLKISRELQMRIQNKVGDTFSIRQELYSFLESNLKEALQGTLPEEEFSKLYSETLAKYRIPHALAIYFAKIKDLQNPLVLSCFIEHLQSVMDNTYLEKRYSTDLNPHLKLMPQKTLQTWQVNRSELLEDGYTIHETDDPQDLFLCGSEIPNSCLTYQGPPEEIQNLLGYLVHGQTRLIAVKSPEGKIVSRAILRLLLNEQNQPVLLLERIYAAKKGFEDAIHQIAKQKATELGCDLTERNNPGSYTSNLSSVGGPAPREWIDGIHGFSEDGIFTICSDNLIRIHPANS